MPVRVTELDFLRQDLNIFSNECEIDGREREALHIKSVAYTTC